jgi:hypothetical protein
MDKWNALDILLQGRRVSWHILDGHVGTNTRYFLVFNCSLCDFSHGKCFAGCQDIESTLISARGVKPPAVSSFISIEHSTKQIWQNESYSVCHYHVFYNIHSTHSLFVLFFSTLFASEWGTFLVNLCNCISFTFHAGDFFISYFSNTIFINEVKRMLNRRASENSQTGRIIHSRATIARWFIFLLPK